MGVTINKEPKAMKPKEALSKIAEREIEKASKKTSRGARRAAKRAKATKEKVVERLGVAKTKTSREEMLRKAKILGLFQYNKSERQYEIIVPIHDYRLL